MRQKLSWKSVEALPSQPELPDPFLRPDGTRIRDRRQWSSLRRHWLAQVLYYEYGQLPPTPRGIEAQEMEQTDLADIPARRREVRLRILTPVPLEMRVVLFRPKKRGKLPAVLNGDLGWGEFQPEIVQEVVRRGDTCWWHLTARKSLPTGPNARASTRLTPTTRAKGSLRGHGRIIGWSTSCTPSPMWTRGASPSRDTRAGARPFCWLAPRMNASR